MPIDSKADPIKHVVLLMLENHSFDEMLGCFQELHHDLDGVNAVSPPRFNTDAEGVQYFQAPKDAYCMRFDPGHELEDVQRQIADGNSGFIKNFVSFHQGDKPTPQDCKNIMGYYKRGFLPALHALAEDFTICDRWFSSLPGPTWPNRFFALSGTSSGYVKMPEGLLEAHLDTITAQTQTTLFDRLNEKNKKWKIFYYDFPNTLCFANQRKPENLANYYSINEFFKLTGNKNDESKFPDFAFIEPKYFGLDQNDDHPPHNIMKAEKLVADVYNALRSNDSLWQTTLLVVVFDEHGGFYDHVTPPDNVPPPDNKYNQYDFTQYGVRVPAILVSPWVERGVDHTVYDHTSLLRYLSDKWSLGPLGQRTVQANSIDRVIRTVKRDEKDTIAAIRVPFSDLIIDDGNGDTQAMTGHQKALQALAAYIERERAGTEDALFDDTVTEAGRLSRALEAAMAWIGKKLQAIGNKSVAAGTKTQDTVIKRTTDVAARLIQRRA